MMKYVSIKSALRFIPRPLFDQSSDLDFMSWMLDGYRLLELPVTAENKVKIYEIKNGRVELPQEIKEINLITYLAETPSSNDLTSFLDCVCDKENTSTDLDTNNVCNYTIAYKQFLTSSYFKNNYKPLLYVGNNSPLLCDKCPNKYSSCKNTFTIDKYNILHTNLNDGFLCIDYSSEMTDDSGDFLILDLTEVKQFLAYYATAKHWEERAATKEQNAGNIVQDTLMKAEIWLRKARAVIIMRGINPQTISDAQNDGYQKWLQIPEHYVYSR